MAGEIRAAQEGECFRLRPIRYEEEDRRVSTRNPSENRGEGCCAELFINGQALGYPSEGCWCPVLHNDPSDEVIFNLGKSVLEVLANRPLKGQDGSKMVLVEFRI